MENTKERIQECFRTLANQVGQIQDPELLNSVVEILKESCMNGDLDNRSWLDSIPTEGGIYYFEVKFNSNETYSKKGLKNFGELWNTEKSKNLVTIHRPRCYQTRINKVCSQSSFQSVWIPFYLGKAGNLRSRIGDHVFNPANDMTWALKLGIRDEAVKMISGIRVSTLNLELEPLAYSFSGYLEGGLRSILNPIVGKQ